MLAKNVLGLSYSGEYHGRPWKPRISFNQLGMLIHKNENNMQIFVNNYYLEEHSGILKSNKNREYIYIIFTEGGGREGGREGGCGERGRWRKGEGEGEKA